ncbi:MAG: hypothetical protein P8N49_07780 [Opitutales bacterium]|nr:hypothetical protein [Opitutales bacterium]
MTLHIFRTLAFLGLVALAVMYFVNVDHFDPLEDELIEAVMVEQNASLTFELDQNKSEEMITALYRERSKMRQQVEELQGTKDKFEQDIELLAPVFDKIKRRKTDVDKELEEIQSKLQDAEVPYLALEEENKPLFEEHITHQEEQKKQEEMLIALEKEANALGGDLNALEKERETATSNYTSKREEILLEIRHPGHLYYGDKAEVSVSSKAPSGKGLFVNQGRESGIREDMIFLVQKSDAFNEIPLILKSAIVEDQFSFLELYPIGMSQKVLNVNDGEKLFLIRTGDSNTSE